MSDVIACFVVVVVLAIVAGFVGAGRWRSSTWLLIVLLVWPIMLLAIVMVPKMLAKARQVTIEGAELRPCRACRKLLHRKAAECRHCGLDLTAEAG